MIILITGGSGSGKSAYAEKLATDIADNKKYYIATMQIYDEEGSRKVLRHRKLRSDKDFETIEQPVDINKVGEQIDTANATALLECMSNLAANEMFRGGEIFGEKYVVEKITGELDILNKCLTHLVIVTNNIFDDGIGYDELTKTYIRTLGRINREIAAKADRVYEVVAGIPVLWKEKVSDVGN